ncbi:MAG: BA14K family protein [Phyllobacterium sp.]
MNKITRFAILAAAAVATVGASLSTASADHRRGGWNDGPRYHHRYRDRSGDALAAGVVGLAAGALLGSALSQPRYSEPPRVIYDQNPNYYPAAPQYRRVTAPRYGSYGVEPWSQDWYRYCSDRYRSFNAQTGTYRGYDGADHFCVAN